MFPNLRLLEFPDSLSDESIEGVPAVGFFLDGSELLLLSLVCTMSVHSGTHFVETVKKFIIFMSHHWIQCFVLLISQDLSHGPFKQKSKNVNADITC